MDQDVASEGQAHRDRSGDGGCDRRGDSRGLDNGGQRAGGGRLVADCGGRDAVSAGGQGEARDYCNGRDEATKVHTASLVMDE